MIVWPFFNPAETVAITAFGTCSRRQAKEFAASNMFGGGLDRFPDPDQTGGIDRGRKIISLAQADKGNLSRDDAETFIES